MNTTVRFVNMSGNMLKKTNDALYPAVLTASKFRKPKKKGVGIILELAVALFTFISD